MSDEITTIFVVGFPDDMKEREFQNMFTFSPGFEAATLKIPVAVPLDDTERDSSSIQKKQIIGFAKFNTRLEALKAKDILTGRKIDSDRNCVLKAEMAKKNLHIKRSGLSSLGLATGVSTTFGLDTPGSGALNFPLTQQPATASHALASQITKPNSTIPTSSSSTSLHVQQQPPRTSGLTNNMLASANRPENLRISAAARTFNPFNDSPLASAPILGANSVHRSFSNAAAAAAAAANVGGGHQYVSAFSSDNSVGERNTQMMAAPPGTAGVMGSFMYGNEQMNGNSGLHHRRGSFHGSTPNETAANAQQSLSDSTVVSADNAEEYQPQPQQQQKQRPAVLDIAALQPRLNQLGLGQMSATNMMSPMGGASAMPYSAAPVLGTPVGMVLPMATTRSVNSNDQNPPCNTLYVGNLPVGAKEEELRLLFQAAMGYKRMSFKAKPNSGPMCFVEFESIDFATLAMSDMDGRMLSNSAGGGIRLSYSKNPLGVRSQNNPNSATAAAAVLSSAAIAAAAAAMAGGYHQGGSVAHYGYPMSALQTPSNPPVTTRQEGSSPSPPTQSGQLNRGPGMTPSLHHQHQSISSSTGTSPIPSPNTAVHGSGGEVPKDALSFLHQPIHRLHKQATSNETISTSSPPGTTSTPPLTQ